MRRARLFCALGVSLWSAAAAGRQAAVPIDIPVALRAHVRDERFQVVSSVRGLPLGVRNQMQVLFGGVLDIADPGVASEATSVGASGASPIRRLVAAGCSYDHCLVYYERSGRRGTWRVALFHWTPDATRLEWGGMAPGGLKTIDEVRSAALGGAITGNVESW